MESVFVLTTVLLPRSKVTCAPQRCVCPVCRYGDMRVLMTYQLFSMWQNLGEMWQKLSSHLLLHRHHHHSSDLGCHWPQVRTRSTSSRE